MRRRQLFEFTDLDGVPPSVRGLVTEFLRTIIEILRPFDAEAERLIEILRATGDERIVDLCSGAGGPWRRLAPLLRARSGRGTPVVLTDRFPRPDALGPPPLDPPISYWPASIDASRVPAELTGLRTIFDGFHHFPPDRAERILGDAIASGQGIAVYEMLERSWKGLCGSLCSPIAVLVLTPFVTPFRWSRLLFTYVIPVAPLLITWDATVSTLRCYTPGELLAMAKRAGGEHYAWSAGTRWSRGVPVTHLVGHPSAEGRGRS